MRQISRSTPPHVTGRAILRRRCRVAAALVALTCGIAIAGDVSAMMMATPPSRVVIVQSATDTPWTAVVVCGDLAGQPPCPPPTLAP